MDAGGAEERWRWVAAIGGTLAVAALAVALGEQPAAQFDEGRLGTWASCLLLSACAAVAYDTWRTRRAEAMEGARAVLWLVIAAAFLYLALDEALSWHEKLDRFVHRKLLGIEATDITKRLDDVIVGAYALLGLAVLWRFRDELARVPGLARVLAVAMALLLLHVALDMANHPDAIRALAERGPRRRLLRLWLPVAEETLKLVAEAVFLLGFLRARRHARRPALPAPALAARRR